MIQVRQAIDDRHGSKPGKFLDDFLAEGSDHYPVAIARHDTGGILDRLAASHLGVSRGQKEGVAAQVDHAGLERHPGAS